MSDATGLGPEQIAAGLWWNNLPAPIEPTDSFDPNELYAVPLDEQLDEDPHDYEGLASPGGHADLFDDVDPDAGEIVELGSRRA